MPVSFQIVIFALIAAFVLFQLYNVLGKRVGRQPEDNKSRTPLPAAPGADQPAVPKTPGVDAATLAAIAGLKARDPAWGLRDRDAVIATAREHGLAFTLRIPMPANNLVLLFRRA